MKVRPESTTSSAGTETRGAVTYPQRPSHFAHRYTRLLTKTCAAQEMGHVAFCLCVTIAHQEDAKRYKGPVTFFNEQLMPLIGVAKWEALDHARTRAVNAGWLHYEQGNRGLRRPGRYWVTLPGSLDDLADAPCDETQYPAKGDSVGSQSPTQSPIQYPAKGDREGDREGEHSTLTPNPIPVDSSEPLKTAASEPAVLTFPCVGNGPKEYLLAKSQAEEWQEVYPALDVLAECRKALQWIKAHRDRRKTARGMPRFLLGWLNRSQNKAGRPGPANAAANSASSEPLPEYAN